jgi:hypothetical protein
MPKALADSLDIARCCLRKKGQCETSSGGECQVKKSVFRNFQRKSTETKKREAAEELASAEMKPSSGEKKQRPTTTANSGRKGT